MPPGYSPGVVGVSVPDLCIECAGRLESFEDVVGAPPDGRARVAQLAAHRVPAHRTVES